MIEIAKYFKYRLFQILEFIYSHSINSAGKSVLFVNTGQIGDLIVSSVIMENDEFFNNDIYFLLDRKFLKLFNSYSGKIKLIPVRLNLYKYFLIYKFIVLTKLKKKNLKISMNITAARGFINDEITLLSGASIKYATCSNHYYLGEYYGSLLDKKYDEILFKNIKSEYEKNFKIISFITEAKEKHLRLVNEKTFNLKTSTKENYICISPFSSLELKNWEPENYKYLIEALCKAEKILLLGSKRQSNKLGYLKSDNFNVEIVDCGLDKLPEIISKCKLFVGNDSGLTHLAYRLGKPLIGIIGGGCFGIFFPYKTINQKTEFFYNEMECFGCEWRCIYDDPFCINKVDKNLVLNKILKFIAK